MLKKYEKIMLIRYLFKTLEVINGIPSSVKVIEDSFNKMNRNKVKIRLIYIYKHRYNIID